MKKQILVPAKTLITHLEHKNAYDNWKKQRAHVNFIKKKLKNHGVMSRHELDITLKEVFTRLNNGN